MPITLSASDLSRICREADCTAARIVRQLRLSAHEREDICQDLLVAMIARLPRFDPNKSGLATFLGVVARHEAWTLVQRRRDERRFFGAAPNSVGGTVEQTVAATPRDGIPYGDAPAILPLPEAGAYEDIALAIDVARAVAALPSDIQPLCHLLLQHTSAEVRVRCGLARATFYRRLREIRMRFLLRGVRAPA